MRSAGLTDGRTDGHPFACRRLARETRRANNVKILSFVQRARFHERRENVFVIKTYSLIIRHSSRRRGTERAGLSLRVLFRRNLSRRSSQMVWVWLMVSLEGPGEICRFQPILATGSTVLSPGKYCTDFVFSLRVPSYIVVFNRK